MLACHNVLYDMPPVASRRYTSAMPSYRRPASPFLIIAVLVLCFLLIALGLYLSSRPVPSGTYTPPSSPTTTAAPDAVPSATPTPSAQMMLGNPSGATPDAANRDNYLMIKPYYALSYNDSKGEPNWVSWRVIASDLGDAPRKRVFDPDDTLPFSFYHVQTRDYTRSGFDRGHMCPHSDRAANIEMSYATFVMSNIVPQAPNNNRKAWAQLENYSRELVRAGDRLYITSGPYGRGGVGSNGPLDVLANGRTVVPATTWKVILVTPDSGRDDLASINAGDRVIAVDVPNDEAQVGEAWAPFRCSAASIEMKTGLHFFTALPADVRSALDQKVDADSIAPPRPLVHTTE
jgi:endonuclease G